MGIEDYFTFARLPFRGATLGFMSASPAAAPAAAAADAPEPEAEASSSARSRSSSASNSSTSSSGSPRKSGPAGGPEEADDEAAERGRPAAAAAAAAAVAAAASSPSVPAAAQPGHAPPTAGGAPQEGEGFVLVGYPAEASPPVAAAEGEAAAAAAAMEGAVAPVPSAETAVKAEPMQVVEGGDDQPQPQPQQQVPSPPAGEEEAKRQEGEEGGNGQGDVTSPMEVASSSSGSPPESTEPAAPAATTSAAAVAALDDPSVAGPSSQVLKAGRKAASSTQLMVRLIPVLPEWRERLPLVMLQSKPDGSNTPIGIIKELSGAQSIEATADGGEIEIRAREWQQLKEAEALLRLTFRDYDGVSVWWFYTIPTFVSCIISGTTGTEVPELSDPSVGLKCAIAPYDENSTRRAFFLTCPEWDPLNAAYLRIKKGWNYWRFQSLEKQIDRALGVLYGVSIAGIKADGNCLFRAFARATLGDEERHLETRRAIVAFMRASEELRLFIVSDDEAEDSAAYAEKYFAEMDKPGTWGDQVEITAFTRVFGRAVRVFSYNYSENRLLSVVTPTEEGQPAKGPEVWLLHLHGHYSLLAPGVAPKDEGWERMLREFSEEKGERPAAATAVAATGKNAAVKQEKEKGKGGAVVSPQPQPQPAPAPLPQLRQVEGQERTHGSEEDAVDSEGAAAVGPPVPDPEPEEDKVEEQEEEKGDEEEAAEGLRVAAAVGMMEEAAATPLPLSD